VTVFQDFKENFSFKPPFSVEDIHGGRLIGIRGSDFVCFYDWTEYRLIRRIDVVPKDVIWSEDGSSVVLACAESFYVLKYDQMAVQAAVTAGSEIGEDGIEEAFDLVSEVSDKVVSGLWVSDCFVYVSQSQRLHCLVAGSTETIAHLERIQYLLGYMPDQSKLYLVDKELNVVPYTLHLALVEYQSAVMRGGFDAAAGFFAQLPESLHTRVARFLQNQGYLDKALEVSKDDEHCFELAMQLGKLEQAADYILKLAAQPNQTVPPRGKWKSLGDVAMEQGDFVLAKRCFLEAKDLSARFLLATAVGDADEVDTVAKLANEQNICNVAVLCFILLGKVSDALHVLIKANRLPEAAFFARTYVPSELSDVVKLWKKDLAGVNQAIADNLADPAEYPDLFPDFNLTVAAEKAFQVKPPTPAQDYAEEKKLFLGPDGETTVPVLNLVKELTPSGFQNLLMKGAGNTAPAPAPTPAPAAAAAAAPAPAAAAPAATPPPVAEASPEDAPAAPETVVAQEPPGPELAVPAPEVAPPAAETAAVDDLM